MVAENWSQLVQQVDRLIAELRQVRSEARKWKTRAMELEGLHLKDEHGLKLESQARDRELERLRRERKKCAAALEKMLVELDQAQRRIVADAQEEAPGER